jgi:signal transduction histidine kinase
LTWQPWFGAALAFSAALTAAGLLIEVLMQPPAAELGKLLAFMALSGTATMAAGWLAIRGLVRRASLTLRTASFVAAAIGGAAALINLLVVARLMFVSTSHDLPLLVATVAFSVVLTVYFNYRAAGSAVEGIELITAHIEDLASGGYEPRAYPQTTGEVGRLARHVNHLADELRAAEQARRALDQERRDLTAAISHDLRTPLSSVRAMVEAIDDGVVGEPAEVARYVRVIRREVDRLASLIDDLFELARLDAGAPVLQRSPVLLTDIASDVVDAFQVSARQRSVRLDLRVEREPCALLLDGARIERVLNNLVRNALDHTPPGGRIELAISERAEGATLRVSDTGAGIPEAHLAHVWDRFYRVDRSRSRDSSGGDGSGLGLAIVRSIVEAHDGTVAVESSFGRGSAFEILLPAHT